jgi:hypothetical protein
MNEASSTAMLNKKCFDVGVPSRMVRLPISENGFPVPKFVKWIDGVPDFRAVDSAWLAKAVRCKLCWLCGEKLGRHMAFVIGPMCAINRTNSEPPSHLDCARFAVRACPFLTQPKRIRNEHDLPADRIPAPGMPLDRNPGVALIWITESYRLYETHIGHPGMLFALGDPTALEWYAYGRAATREEIMHSIASGLPALRKVAEQEGPDAIATLDEAVARGLALVPA